MQVFERSVHIINQSSSTEINPELKKQKLVSSKNHGKWLTSLDQYDQTKRQRSYSNARQAQGRLFQQKNRRLLSSKKREKDTAIFTENVRDAKYSDGSKLLRRTRTESEGIKSHQSLEPHKFFGKITIHCLKERRQVFEKEVQGLQSQYHYLLRKIDRIQRKKDQQQMLKARRDLAQNRKRLQSYSLQNIKQSNQQLFRRRKEMLKEEVVSHRFKKMQNIIKNQECKFIKGAQQRNIEEELHQQLQYMRMSKIQFNKSRCERQKLSKVRKQIKLKNRLESRKVIAKSNFQNHWLTQFERQEYAKRQYMQKKQFFKKKIETAIEIYKSIEEN